MPKRTHLSFLLLLGVTLLAACGGGGGSDKVSDPFAYDASKALDLQSKGSSSEAGIRVRDISFKGASGETIPAYLVLPRGKGPHPAVIYAHGSGGSRSDLLPSAVGLAERGSVALVLEMSYSASRAGKETLPEGVEGVRTATNKEIESVVEVRRAVDLLDSLSYVDDKRIGYVGWSAGSRTGAIVSGVEHRIRAFDLLAGGALPVRTYVATTPADDRSEVENLLERTDPLRYVAQAAPSALLFQDGRHDEVVPKAALTDLVDSASKPKELRWYDSGHVPSTKAWVDSRRWLVQRLGLT